MKTWNNYSVNFLWTSGEICQASFQDFIPKSCTSEQKKKPIHSVARAWDLEILFSKGRHLVWIWLSYSVYITKRTPKLPFTEWAALNTAAQPTNDRYSSWNKPFPSRVVGYLLTNLATIRSRKVNQVRVSSAKLQVGTRFCVHTVFSDIWCLIPWHQKCWSKNQWSMIIVGIYQHYMSPHGLLNNVRDGAASVEFQIHRQKMYKTDLQWRGPNRRPSRKCSNWNAGHEAEHGRASVRDRKNGQSDTRGKTAILCTWWYLRYVWRRKITDHSDQRCKLTVIAYCSSSHQIFNVSAEKATPGDSEPSASLLLIAFHGKLYRSIPTWPLSTYAQT